MDISENLKRIYRYLDSLDTQIKQVGDPQIADSLKTCAKGIRAYVDGIAEEVDYFEGDDDEDDDESEFGQ